MADVNLLQLSALAKTSVTDKTIRWVPVETSTTPPTADSAPLRMSFDEINKSMLDTTYALTVASGSLSSSTPAIDVTQTWNNVATTFTAWKLNVTDTTSATNSKLVDLQVGGATALSVGRPVSNTVSLRTDSNNLQLVGGVAIYLNGDRIGCSSTTQFNLASTSTLAWCSSTSITASEDTILLRDAADTLAMRRTTNAQKLHLYNTYTSGSVYERGFARWASNIFEIGTEHVGASARQLDFKVAGTSYLSVLTTGIVQLSASNVLSWSGRSRISSASDGTMLLTNAAGTSFTSLMLGGTTSSFPALKRSTTELQARLADDSDYTRFTSKSITLTGGTITANAPLIDASRTWNNVAVTFSAWKLNVTNTASATGSKLLDLQIASAPQLELTTSRDLRLYNSWTSPTVLERGFMRWSSNVFIIGTEHIGATGRDIQFYTGGSPRLYIGQAGGVSVDSGGTWFWQTRSLMKSPADGQITFQNFAATGFDLLQFGGTTSSFPALKRNGTTLECKLANDSAYTAFKALTLEATTSMIVPSITFGGSTILYEEIANAVSFQNSTNAQSINIYNTYTSGSNYERGFARWVSNVFEVGTETVGGSIRDLALKTNNVARLTFDGTTGAGTFAGSVTHNANVTMGDGVHLICSSLTTGTNIATSTNQLLGFWGQTPVVQQVLATGAGATVDNVISLLQTLGLCKQS